MFREALAGVPDKAFALIKATRPRVSELSIVAIGLRSALVRRCKEAEQAMRLIADTGGEVQPITGSGCMVVAKAQRPQAVVLDRMSVSVAEKTIEAPALDIVNSDLPAPGIADQQVVAEEAEICRCQCYTQGAFSHGPFSSRCNSLPLGENLSTNPKPGKSKSSCFVAFCLA